MSRNNGTEYLTGFLFMGVIGALIFMGVDIVTGTDKLVMAVITDKTHKITTDKDGDTTHHFLVSFKRDDGVFGEIDVNRSKFHGLQVGNRVVLRVTIGGKSGKEYNRDINLFTGGEQ